MLFRILSFSSYSSNSFSYFFFSSYSYSYFSNSYSSFSYSSCSCYSFSSSYSSCPCYSFSSYSNSFSSCSFNSSFSCSPFPSCSSFCSCSLLSYLLIATLVQREFLSCFPFPHSILAWPRPASSSKSAALRIRGITAQHLRTSTSTFWMLTSANFSPLFLWFSPRSNADKNCFMLMSALALSFSFSQAELWISFSFDLARSFVRDGSIDRKMDRWMDRQTEEKKVQGKIALVPDKTIQL